MTLVTDFDQTNKMALYLSVNLFSTKVLVEMGPPFYVVTRATRRTSRLKGKGSTFIHSPIYAQMAKFHDINYLITKVDNVVNVFI